MNPLECPVGFRQFHSDPPTNYQLNRWLPGADESEIASAAKRLSVLSDWKHVMLELAYGARSQERYLHASTYFRAAEFFMDPDDPEREPAYDEYVRLVRRAFAETPHVRHAIDFEGGLLGAVHFAARSDAGASPRGALVIHGGFDSCHEEFWGWGPHFSSLGYDVYIFDGPGQGNALRRHGMKLRLDWEVPTSAVLDHFEIEECTLLGVSLGGLLAMRAAAFEPRVCRVAALDVMFDRFDCFAHANGADKAQAMERIHAAGARDAVEELMATAMRASEATSWAIGHGLWTSGCRTAFDYVGWIKQFTAEAFSSLVTQDVLLMAGSQDHLVPTRQFFRQGQALASARSLQMRMFSERESAQSHCQVGNIPLALDQIELWLAGLERRDARPRR